MFWTNQAGRLPPRSAPTRSTPVSTSPARPIGALQSPRPPGISALSTFWSNNAGIFLGKSLEEASLDEWHRLCAVNLTGVFLGTKLVLPALRDSGTHSPQGSAIVNK